MKKKEQRHQIEERINVRAWTDPNFKAALKSHPVETLKGFGLDVPAHAKIMIHEEDGNTWHLTLRKAPPHAGNLSEEQLQNIAAAGEMVGGKSGGCSCA